MYLNLFTILIVFHRIFYIISKIHGGSFYHVNFLQQNQKNVFENNHTFYFSISFEKSNYKRVLTTLPVDVYNNIWFHLLQPLYMSGYKINVCVVVDFREKYNEKHVKINNIFSKIYYIFYFFIVLSLIFT